MGKRRDDPDLYFRKEVGVWYTWFYDHQGKQVRRSTSRALALKASLPVDHVLRAELPEERRPYLDVFVGLGLRDSEVYRIRPSDVAEDGSVVHVPGTKTEGADRMVEVTPHLHALFAARAKERAGETFLFPTWTNVRRALIGACRRAGIDAVSPNDLRRTFATWLAEAGVPR